MSAFLCPITHSTMVDPVQTCDGMTYERVAIERWLQTHNTSPLTGVVLANKRLTTNFALRDAIAGAAAAAAPSTSIVEQTHEHMFERTTERQTIHEPTNCISKTD